MPNEEVKQAREKAREQGYAKYLWEQFKEEWNTKEKAYQSAKGFILHALFYFLLVALLITANRNIVYCKAEITGTDGIEIISFHYEGKQTPTLNAYNDAIAEINENHAYSRMLNLKTNKIQCKYDPKRAWKELKEKFGK